MFGAPQSFFMIQALFLVHGHPVADTPGVRGPLCVLELCNVGLWGVAAGLVGIGQVISAPLLLGAGRNSKGLKLPKAVWREIKENRCGYVSLQVLSRCYFAGLGLSGCGGWCGSRWLWFPLLCRA